MRLANTLENKNPLPSLTGEGSSWKSASSVLFLTFIDDLKNLAYHRHIFFRIFTQFLAFFLVIVPHVLMPKIHGSVPFAIVINKFSVHLIKRPNENCLNFYDTNRIFL